MTDVSLPGGLVAALVALAALLRCCPLLAPRLTSRLPYTWPGLLLAADVPASWRRDTGAESTPVETLCQLAGRFGAVRVDVDEWAPTETDPDDLFAATRDRERALLRWPGGLELLLIASSAAGQLAPDDLTGAPVVEWLDLAEQWRAA